MACSAEFDDIEPADLDMRALHDIIASKLTPVETRTLANKLFRSFRIGEQKAQVFSDKGTNIMMDLMSKWEATEAAEDRTWDKLITALVEARRKDLIKSVKQYLTQKGMDETSTIDCKEDMDFLLDTICNQLVEEKHLEPFCLSLFKHYVKLDSARSDIQLEGSDVQVTAMHVLRDWMQEAEPPAVNDLVKAVKSINQTMYNQLVDYLKKLPQPYSGLGERAVPRVSSVLPSDRQEIVPNPNQDCQQILHQIQTGKAYSITKRGRAVIINNKMFPDGKTRHGSEQDMEDLQELFGTFLNFQTKTYVDLNAEVLRTKLHEESRHQSLPESDAFVLVIMSHGNDTGIISKDGNTVPLADIFDQFSAVNCPTLAGKPKLIFIQACRGDHQTFGVKKSSEKSLSKLVLTDTFSNLNTKSIESDQMDGSAKAAAITEEGKEIWIHELSDIVIAMATVPGFVSYRNKQEGSRFMQTLKEVFLELAATDHLLELLTEVNNRVCLMETKGNKVQQPEFMIRLRKKLYFLPGYSPQ